MKNQKSMGNKGFSLVELIVVIAIMAVLVGVLAPQFIKYVEKSKESTDIQNLDSIVTVLQTYYADHDIPGTGVTISKQSSGYFGTGVDEADAALTNAGAATTAVKSSKWTTDISAKINSDGSVTYTGVADHYKANSTKDGFEAVTASSSSENAE
jgi:type IV pilus assembly protein PilA